VPLATGVLPWLTPGAAIGLALLMVFAIVLHARRPVKTGIDGILGSIAVLILFARLVVSPV
jgi:hypothetical protein